MVIVKPNLVCYKYKNPCSISFFWKNITKFTLSFEPRVNFSSKKKKKGIHLTKNKEISAPLWFRGKKNLSFINLMRGFWSCHYLSAEWCINTDMQRFTIMSLEIVNLDSVMSFFPESSWSVWTSFIDTKNVFNTANNNLLAGIFGDELNLSCINWSLWTWCLKSLLQDITQEWAICSITILNDMCKCCLSINALAKSDKNSFIVKLPNSMHYFATFSAFSMAHRDFSGQYSTNHLLLESKIELCVH